MTINCPDDFDAEDIAYATALVPDGAIVTQMLTIVSWLDPDSDGAACWRVYNSTAHGERVVACLGLLELAKLDLVARSGCMPDYDEYDEDDDG